MWDAQQLFADHDFTTIVKRQGAFINLEIEMYDSRPIATLEQLVFAPVLSVNETRLKGIFEFIIVLNTVQ